MLSFEDVKGIMNNVHIGWKSTVVGIVLGLAGLYMLVYNVGEWMAGLTLIVIGIWLALSKDPKRRIKKKCNETL